MPQAQGGGSLVTGANVVDESLSTADLAAAAILELEPVCLTCCPQPNWIPGTGTNSVSGRTLDTNTVLHIGQIVVPRQIVVNKISFNVTTVTVAGVVNVALFSEDGQTRLISFATASISGTGLVITTLGSPVVLPAGVYYLGFNPVGTANVDTWAFGNVSGVIGSINEEVTGKAILNGTITVTASTMPSTITPTSITGGASTSQTIIIRLDT